MPKEETAAHKKKNCDTKEPRILFLNPELTQKPYKSYVAKVSFL
jgi:hypothetical protein